MVRLTRRALTGGLMAGGALGLGACGDVLSRPFFSSDTHSADYPTVEAVRMMSRLLDERSGGRLSIRIYSGGQLGSERDTLELTVFGGLDMNRVNLAPLNAFAPETVILSLPFVFESEPHMRAALDGAPGRAVLDALEPHGLIGLCFYDSGARSFYNIRRPIRTPDDMRGLKIRVQNSDLYVSMVEALGANATPMDLSEVYQGLMQGVIDGAENNWPSYESTRHFETAPFYSLTGHVMAPEVLVMSARRWHALSDTDKALVSTCARESVPYMRDLWDARVSAARERITASGVEVNEVDDVSDFADLMRPVWERFVRTPSQQRLLEDIRNMAGGADA
ncbi:TRAP dicarboxylate transporter subunit DctP [Glycocaulis alkaliphilus]|uniref:TRAP dicarboxylate transporter subunit DctP n=1 Tax=Glycocaulis alkaliphilus TaxID=1434191 RepID=A0A3T0EAC6_9PROT|nr:TRAP transporter substrate-binding protein [Glycocaulis alkaliphilus]AZU04116.1 TRAP dicarboxylate transporter subunit DctP [Glycocaulis alkaliphilus]GGB76011.1 C4-dicarboxylate ABC transporter [Glycocaulis alkaliphilus]